eukprot:1824312-Pleurochrysis_carterae.AAC.1
MPQIGQRGEHRISLQPINGLTTGRTTIQPMAVMRTPTQVATPNVSRRFRRISVLPQQACGGNRESGNNRDPCYASTAPPQWRDYDEVPTTYGAYDTARTGPA